MSKFGLVLALSLLSFSAFAGHPDDDFKIEYLSWCEGDKVMQYNDKGEVELRFDCTQTQQSCRNYQITRWYTTTVVAACVEKTN